MSKKVSLDYTELSRNSIRLFKTLIDYKIKEKYVQTYF